MTEQQKLKKHLESENHGNLTAFNQSRIKKNNTVNPNVFQKLKQSPTDLYQEKLVKVILYGSQVRGTATPDSEQVSPLTHRRSPFSQISEPIAPGLWLWIYN